MKTGKEARKALYVVMLFAMLAAACGPSAEEIAQTEAAETAAAQASEDAIAAQTQAVLDAAATETQQLLDLRTATAGARETASAERAAERQTATAEGILTATAQAQPMVDLVNQLVADGVLTSGGGEFFRLDDYDRSEAELNTFFFTSTGFSPDNFVLRMTATWESAATNANWFNSGCGVAFRTENDEYYHVKFALDGRAYLRRRGSGGLTPLGDGYSSSLAEPNGGAELMIVANGNTITLFVDGERVHQRQDTRLTSGGLFFTVSSGTNAGFGTRCQMTNIDLWILDE